MLLFAHVGLALGAAVLVRQSLAHRRQPSGEPSAEKEAEGPSQPENGAPNITGSTPRSRFFDWRLVVLGSMLPDLIDKPVGALIFSGFFEGNGRIITHTLIVNLALLLAGLYLYRQRQRIGVLVVALGSLGHLILDSMWEAQNRVTLFWPFQGWTFPPYEDFSLSNWISAMLEALETNPAVFLPEMGGSLIAVAFVVYLAKKKALRRFLRSGEVPA